MSAKLATTRDTTLSYHNGSLERRAIVTGCHNLCDVMETMFYTFSGQTAVRLHTACFYLKSHAKVTGSLQSSLSYTFTSDWSVITHYSDIGLLKLINFMQLSVGCDANQCFMFYSLNY